MMAKIFRVIDTMVEYFVVLLFVVMLLVGGLQVFNRFFLGTPLTWSEEVQKYAHIWLIFLTIPICYRRGRHIGMEIITSRLPKVAQTVLAVGVDLLWLGLGWAITYYTWRIMQVASWQYSPSLEIRMDCVYLGELVGGLYLMLTSLRIMVANLTGGRPGAAGRKDENPEAGEPVC